MTVIKLFTGWVSHRRTTPVNHQFRYKVFQVWLDIKHLHLIDKISPWWSSNKRNLVQFKRENYLPGDADLYKQVRATILKHTNKQFDGEAYLLANLSYWGYCYNPASFICCYQNQRLSYLISEIHNTPWGQRFVYVHEVDHDIKDKEWHTAYFDKAFHVSPFMPMNLTYKWRYKVTGSTFTMSMNLLQENQSIFNASLNLKGHPISTRQANFIPFKYPFMCFKVLLTIYWQAFKLWLKRVPIYSYPKH